MLRYIFIKFTNYFLLHLFLEEKPSKLQAKQYMLEKAVFVIEMKPATEQVCKKWGHMLEVEFFSQLTGGKLSAKNLRHPRALQAVWTVTQNRFILYAGLGTLAKKAVNHPVKTAKAATEFGKSYLKMRKENVEGGNLAAHEVANREATKKSDAETAAAISALREQYKRVRVKINPRDGSLHVRDTRTKEETAATMNANKKGRESG